MAGADPRVRDILQELADEDNNQAIQLMDILKELQRQDELYGDQNDRRPIEWLGILTKQNLQVSEAALTLNLMEEDSDKNGADFHRDFDPGLEKFQPSEYDNVMEHFRKEITQVAAVCLAILEATE